MRIVLYVIWALFVTGAALACVQAVQKIRRQKQLTAIWPKVQATVTGSSQGWSHGGGGTTRNIRFWPAYQFLDPGGILSVGESEVSYANRPAPGSFLDVAYNPDDPNQSFQVAAPSKAVIGCLIPAFALLALPSFWFIGIFPLG